jgi:hypothetical protein
MSEKESYQGEPVIQSFRTDEWKPVFGKDFIHPCALHPEDEHWYEDDNIPCCPDCGGMLNTEYCIWCGANWLKFGTSRDDIGADAAITLYGDLLCVSCAEQQENEELEEEQEYGDDWWEDDYP